MRGLHLVRKTNVALWRRITCYLIGVIVALGIGAIFLSCLGINCFDYYKDMFTIGMIDNVYAYKSIEGLIKLFVPLLITSLALALAFKMRFWNIGGEGQFITGALMSAIVAYNCPNLPPVLSLLLMFVASFITSGLIGLGVSFLKIKFNTNETLVTLMLNYILLYVITYFGETKAGWNFFLRDDSERPVFDTFPDNAHMPLIKIGDFSLNVSLIFALLLAVMIYILLKYTKRGYEISVVGDSADTARYAGMNVGRIVMRTMFFSAALIGLAGSFAASTSATISVSITNSVGWTGVIVAWLAKLNTPAIIVISLLIAVLQYGCQAASSVYPAIDSHFADILQALVLFAILTADFAANFKIVKTQEASK